MAIAQDEFYVPREIAMKLATGEYTRYGSVVRDRATGRIVKHLKSVGPNNLHQTGNLVKSAAKLVGISSVALASSGAAVAGGAVVAATAAGVAIYTAVKNKQASSSETQLEGAAETKALEDEAGAAAETKTNDAHAVAIWMAHYKNAEKQPQAMRA